MVGRGWWLLAMLVPVLAVAGCATSQSVSKPSDFPYHSTEGSYRLHWRLDREAAWSVTAVGMVEMSRPEPGRDVVVEIRGIDKSGRVVSRSFARSHGEQFTAQLRARGDEDRFDVVLANVPTERGGQ
jgi:hypothetical protein